MEPMDTNETKITTLPDICLDMICDYLNMDNLFNVAQSNMKLVASAVLAFKRHYGQKTIIVDPYKVFLYEDHINKNPELHFMSTNHQFSFLRIFGKVISKLKVIGEIRNENAIRKYLSKYCTNAIIDIESYISFSWHANMTFVPETMCEIDNTTKELAVTCECFSDDLMRKISPQLECLAVQCTKSYIDENCAPFVFNGVKQFILISDDAQVFEENPPPIDFACLTSLRLVGFEYLSQKWWNFIMINKHLTKLTLCPSSNIVNKWKTIRNECLRELLSYLEILEINAQLINLDYLLEILRQCSKLKEIRLYWETYSNNEIAKTLGNIPEGWTLYVGPYQAALINKQFQN